MFWLAAAGAGVTGHPRAPQFTSVAHPLQFGTIELKDGKLSHGAKKIIVCFRNIAQEIIIDQGAETAEPEKLLEAVEGYEFGDFNYGEKFESPARKWFALAKDLLCICEEVGEGDETPHNMEPAKEPYATSNVLRYASVLASVWGMIRAMLDTCGEPDDHVFPEYGSIFLQYLVKLHLELRFVKLKA